MSVPIQLVAARLEGRPYVQLDHNTLAWQDQVGYTVLVNLSNETELFIWRFRLAPASGSQHMHIQMEKDAEGKVDELYTAAFILNIVRGYEQIALEAADIPVLGRDQEGKVQGGK